MTDREPDSILDAQLAEVPLPEGFLDRLRAACPANRVWSDGELDAEILAVAVPRGLLSRCRQVVADEPLELALCQVPVPPGLVPDLQKLTGEEPASEVAAWPKREVLVVPSGAQVGTPGRRSRARPSPRWQRALANLSLAAALAMLVSGGYLAALAALLESWHSPQGAPLTLIVEHSGPLELAADSVGSVEVALAPRANAEPELAADSAEFVALQDPMEAEPGSGASGPAGELLASLRAGLVPGRDMLLVRYGPLGAPVWNEPLAEFNTIFAESARGLEPPAVRGFDRRFLLRHGVYPVVSPAIHPQLRTAQAPLSTSTASYEQAQRRLAEGRWPAPAEVRVEDFLAAVDYGFSPPPPGGLGLTLAAGPSIFGQPLANIPSAVLVQAGVQAAGTPLRRLPATHLIVALDGSQSMQGAGRYEASQRAIGWLARQLGPRDRLSLIVFHDDILETVEAVGRENSGELLYFLERFSPRGRANPGLGIQAALSLAMRNELDDRLAQRVALLTAGGAPILPPALDGLCTLAVEAAAQEAGLSIFELGPLPASDSALAQLASAARGELRGAATAAALRYSLLEALTGSSSIVAPDATLRVSFNPRTVAGYRLLGHEPNALSSAAPARLEADLRVGETATGLFEVWLLPGTEDELAVAEVEWRDPASGETRRERQSLGRLQVAGSFAECAPSLQQAALMAETAEVLKQSYFVQGRPRSLQHVLEGARGASYDVSRHAEFRRWQAFARELERTRGRRAD